MLVLSILMAALCVVMTMGLIHIHRRYIRIKVQNEIDQIRLNIKLEELEEYLSAFNRDLMANSGGYSYAVS